MADFEELQRRGDAEKEGTSPSGDHMPYANFVNWINERTEEPQRNMMKKDLSLRLSGRWICRECCKGAGVHDPEHNPGKDTGDDTTFRTTLAPTMSNVLRTMTSLRS